MPAVNLSHRFVDEPGAACPHGLRFVRRIALRRDGREGDSSWRSPLCPRHGPGSSCISLDSGMQPSRSFCGLRRTPRSTTTRASPRTLRATRRTSAHSSATLLRCLPSSASEGASSIPPKVGLACVYSVRCLRPCRVHTPIFARPALDLCVSASCRNVFGLLSVSSQLIYLSSCGTFGTCGQIDEWRTLLRRRCLVLYS